MCQVRFPCYFRAWKDIVRVIPQKTTSLNKIPSRQQFHEERNALLHWRPNIPMLTCSKTWNGTDENWLCVPNLKVDKSAELRHRVYTYYIFHIILNLNTVRKNTICSHSPVESLLLLTSRQHLLTMSKEMTQRTARKRQTLFLEVEYSEL